MTDTRSNKRYFSILGILACVFVVLLVLWFNSGSSYSLGLRMPGADQVPSDDSGARGNPVLAGQLTRGAGQPANLPGAWPAFRGPNRSAITTDPVAQSWPDSGPRELWGIDVG